MSEKKILIKPQKFEYSGLFIMKEFYHIIDSWLKENGYEKEEKKVREKVHENGKDIKIKYEPYKRLNEFTKYVLKTEITVRNMISLQLEEEGKPKKFNKGDIEIEIEGIKLADTEGHWENKPFYFFLRTIFHKFIIKDEEGRMDDLFKKDFESYKREILDYLNMHKFIE